MASFNYTELQIFCIGMRAKQETQLINALECD